MITGYNPFMAALSILVAIGTSYAALELARTSRILHYHRLRWLFGASALMALGIWSMHMIGMQAVLYAPDPRYSALRLALSVLPPFVGTITAFAYIERLGLNARTLPLASLFMGAGIVAMHYTGMSAFTIANTRITNSPGVVALASAIAVGASAVALRVSFSAPSGYRQMIGAVVLGMAICGMHYTGMSGMRMVMLPGHDHGWTMARVASVRVGIVAVIVSSIMASVAICMAHYSRRLDAVISNANDMMRRGQKLETIGALTGGLIHDFNNVLAVITSAANLAERHPERRNEMRDAVMAAIDRAKGLTTKMLSVSRNTPLALQDVDIAQHLVETETLLRRALRPGVSLRLEISQSLGWVRTDPQAIDMALLNLVINARDAIKGTGAITVCAYPIEIEMGSGLAWQVGATGEFVELSVEDTGCGIAKEDRHHIFDPFFTTKGDEGTGLGLAQVMNFAQQSGGKVTFSTKIGEGTRMRVFLPRRRQDVRAAA